MAFRRGSFAPIVTIVAKTNVAAPNAAVALCISIAIPQSALDGKRAQKHMVSWPQCRSGLGPRSLFLQLAHRQGTRLSSAALRSFLAASQTSRAASKLRAAMPRPTMMSGQAEDQRVAVINPAAIMAIFATASLRAERKAARVKLPLCDRKPVSRN